ncbi:hypothetical protein [Clostridium thermobutyricum]|uniref:Uncharacterized protein n=1 Tax=Clostridium thermobutyricum DSM 4928 TaxID=1121339 RepID=A0A1V4SX23_9CLOT|nr:hypothetical protein [Clostridium thermobutyricum]OPX47888.1 hypothetical protein CLTHE_14590 [Clostridium thermobutyricum DSM 4928]
MKKLIVIIIVICLVIFGIIMPLGNKTGIGSMKIKNEMNGSGTSKIGEYGIAYYSGTISDSDIVNFYNKNVKNSKLNYVTLVDKSNDSEGYVFNGSSGLFSYGKIDKDGMLEKTDKTGIINNDKLEYK